MDINLLLSAENVALGWGKGKDIMVPKEGERSINIELPDDFDTSVIHRSTYDEETGTFSQNTRDAFFLEKSKEMKISDLSSICEETIHAGIDVETTQGVEHFSLSDQDQINLTNWLISAKSLGGEYLYHADGKDCRAFSSDEIIKIGTTGMSFKTYHLSRFQKLKIWVKRLQTKEEVEAVQYDSQLPEDLQTELDTLLTSQSSFVV